MSELWEQAQTAIQAGDTRRAHVHLARLLKEEPRNSEAWYLLSRIVPTDDQKKVFLNKVLKIEPDHVQAQEDLEKLETVVDATFPVSTDASDLDGQAAGDTVPPWMEGAPAPSPLDEAEESDEEEIEELVLDPNAVLEDEIPEWLKEETGNWGREDEEETVSPEPIAEPLTPELAPAGRPQLSLLLVALIFAAVAVFILLAVNIVNYANVL